MLHFAIPLALLSGCKVVDAPDTLEAMMVYGFRNVQNEAESQAVADELPAMVKRNLEEIEKGFRVDELVKADIVAAGAEPGAVEKPIVGALGWIEYRHDLDGVLNAVSHKHRDQIADNTTYFEVVDETDRACFLAGDCDTYTQTAEQITKQPVIGDITQTFTQEFRWVLDGDEPAIVSHVLAPDPVDVSSGLAAVDQQYSFFMLKPQKGGGVERVEAIWAEARLLGADLPDSFLVDSAVNAMGKQAEKVDAWLDTQEN